VWSFGGSERKKKKTWFCLLLFLTVSEVCMWEIYSNGEEAWKGLSDQQTYEEIIMGKRLPKPKDCPDKVYELIGRCCSESRPSFEVICSELKEFYAKYEMQESGDVEEQKEKTKSFKKVPQGEYLGQDGENTYEQSKA
jgi:hypothetical protein